MVSCKIGTLFLHTCTHIRTHTAIIGTDYCPCSMHSGIFGCSCVVITKEIKRDHSLTANGHVSDHKIDLLKGKLLTSPEADEDILSSMPQQNVLLQAMYQARVYIEVTCRLLLLLYRQSHCSSRGSCMSLHTKPSQQHLLWPSNPSLFCYLDTYATI